MCPRIIRFPDTLGHWGNTTTQMDLASTYKEKGGGEGMYFILLIEEWD